MHVSTLDTDDLAIARALGGHGLVLFEDAVVPGLSGRLVEAARVAGRDGDVAVFDPGLDPADGVSVRHAVGLDIARGIDPRDVPDLVADLAVPLDRRDPAQRAAIRDLAEGYLAIGTASPPGLRDFAELADAPGRGDESGAARLALARLHLHLHAYWAVLAGGPESPLPPLDMARVADGRTLLVVRQGGGDLAAALARALLSALERVPHERRPLVAYRGDVPPGWFGAFEALPGYARSDVYGGGAAEPPGRAMPRLGALNLRFRTLRRSWDAGAETLREGRSVLVARDGASVLVAARGREALVAVRDPNGWPVRGLLRREAGPARPEALRALGLDFLRGRARIGRGGQATGVAAGGWTPVSETRDRLDARFSECVGAGTPGEAFARDLDLDLVAACLEAGGGAALHRWARGAAARADFVKVWRALGGLAWRAGTARAVDAGARTVPLVAALVAAPPAQTRRLQGRDALPASWAEAVRDPGGDGLHLLRDIDVNRLPRIGDGAEWAAFVHCVDRLDRFRYATGSSAIERPFELLLRVPGAGWARRAARLVGGPETAEDAADLLGALARRLAAGGGMGVAPATGLAARILTRNRSLADILSLAIRWRASGCGRGSGPAGTLPDGVSWAPLFLGPVRVSGVVAVPLSSSDDLRREGAVGRDEAGLPGLDHCVATYAEACRDGLAHIVALRDPAGSRLATAEFALEGGGIALRQLRGRHNGEPPEDARRACDWLASSLRDGRLPYAPGLAPPARPAVAVPDPAAGWDWDRVMGPDLTGLAPAEIALRLGAAIKAG